jgi:hypothetical protein
MGIQNYEFAEKSTFYVKSLRTVKLKSAPNVLNRPM